MGAAAFHILPPGLEVASPPFDTAVKPACRPIIFEAGTLFALSPHEDE